MLLRCVAGLMVIIAVMGTWYYADGLLCKQIALKVPPLQLTVLFPCDVLSG